MRRKGFVSLVGAGPGDPSLLTLKGYEALQRAEVVIYDHLVSEQILDMSAPDAVRIYVGKAHGEHAMPQERIHRLLIRHASRGRAVVRLKGGDPMLFGRGGEEAKALAAARIPFEIVPGVTSAVAVPAYAGIPVTHRDLASSVAIVTGHEDPMKPRTALRWEHLATATDTFISLMSVRTLPALVAQLRRHGRSPATPCAVIERGTLPTQRTIQGTLQTIVAQCNKSQVSAPAVLIVGDVVSLRASLQWVERTPLFGRRIVVTRPNERADDLIARLTREGAEVIKLPALELVGLKPTETFRRAIQQIERFDWVFFTSPEGIGWFRRALVSLRKDLRILAGRHIGAIGPKTAAAIERVGIHVDDVPSTFSQEGMLNDLKRRRLAGTRGLILNAVGSREVLEEGLKAQGMEVLRVPLYRAVMPARFVSQVKAIFQKPVEPRLHTGGSLRTTLRVGRHPALGHDVSSFGGIDLVTVTSASCVTHLVRALRAGGLARHIRTLRFASIGPVTSATVREHGGQVAVEAAVSTVEGLVEAIVAASARRPSQKGARRGVSRVSASPAATI